MFYGSGSPDAALSVWVAVQQEDSGGIWQNEGACIMIYLFSSTDMPTEPTSASGTSRAGYAGKRHRSPEFDLAQQSSVDIRIARKIRRPGPLKVWLRGAERSKYSRARLTSTA